ncbi:MAG: DUF1259 domain-containing protein, partial [Gemmatimonas sp.]
MSTSRSRQKHPSWSAPLAAIIGSVVVVVAVGCRPADAKDDRAAGTSVSADASRPAAVDWKAVDVAMGRPGVAQPGEVQRYNFPRSDLTVVVRDPRGDVGLKPSLALGGWIAMHGTGPGNKVMAMGDLVLTEDELPQVMSRLQQGGVELTAVH